MRQRILFLRPLIGDGSMFERGRGAILALIVWAIAGVLLAFFQRPVFDALWTIAGLVYVAYAGSGFLLVTVIGAYSIANRNKIAALVCVGFFAVGAALLYLEPQIGSIGNTAIGSYRFNKNVDEYNKIVAELAGAPVSEHYGSVDDIRYVVDGGPPVRVAFPQPGGILDNWEGIVFDPTGEVKKAVGWARVDGKQAFTAPKSVVSLFGGDIVSCAHIQGSYYRCWFT